MFNNVYSLSPFYYFPIFSSAVFGENLRYCYSLGIIVVHCRRRRAKTVAFCNISVFSEDIYLKLRICVHYPKSNPYYQGRQFNFFLQNYAPFSTYNLLSTIKHPTDEPWHLNAALLFFFFFFFFCFFLKHFSHKVFKSRNCAVKD